MPESHNTAAQKEAAKKGLKGPAIFLAQFMSDNTPFDTLRNAARQMAEFGYLGVQIPSWDARAIDLAKAAESKDYCDEIKGICAEEGVVVTELSTHLQGQLVAVHPAYDTMFDGFAPPEMHNNPAARTEWAVDQMMKAAKASQNMGIKAHVTFSGALLWPFLYPWPQRPAGLVEESFAELARRWRPILDAFDAAGVDVCYEIHPGEDLHDGATFERFLEEVDNHPRCKILYDPSHFMLQQLDYLQFIEFYHERIGMFHVKDAEFNPTGKQGVYGAYSAWADRAGRFRSLGDGQIDFRAIFSQLTHYGFDGWAVVEWECALKDNMQGAREGAAFVRDHMITPAAGAFDDFAGGVSDRETNRKILGLS
jgi:sugar phosphate isomerase/epimerase